MNVLMKTDQLLEDIRQVNGLLASIRNYVGLIVGPVPDNTIPASAILASYPSGTLASTLALIDQDLDNARTTANDILISIQESFAVSQSDTDSIDAAMERTVEAATAFKDARDGVKMTSNEDGLVSFEPATPPSGVPQPPKPWELKV